MATAAFRIKLEPDRTAARELNRLGQLVRHYDEAGRLDFEEFDFKGNLLLKTRAGDCGYSIAGGLRRGSRQ